MIHMNPTDRNRNRMEGTELEELISRLPKEEVRSVIGFDSILRP